MAQQRKTPNVPTRTATSSGKRAAGAKSAPATSATTTPKPSGPGRTSPPRKKSTSIVNQRQTPWTLIATVLALLLFAAGVVIFAVTRHSSTPAALTGDARYTRPEIAAAEKIQGIIYKPEPNHTHVETTVDYNTVPPIGGNHSPYWATCAGTVYDHQLANENAVHMLEHGAVWIAYDPTKITGSALAALVKYVDGVNYMALTPYNGLDAATKAPISVQAWDYQLRADNATDPRIQQFIDVFRANNTLAPEAHGDCANDDGFIAAESTPGHPFNGA